MSWGLVSMMGAACTAIRAAACLTLPLMVMQPLMPTLILILILIC